jgi:hypothetical protein
MKRTETHTKRGFIQECAQAVRGEQQVASVLPDRWTYDRRMTQYRATQCAHAATAWAFHPLPAPLRAGNVKHFGGFPFTTTIES